MAYDFQAPSSSNHNKLLPYVSLVGVGKPIRPSWPISHTPILGRIKETLNLHTGQRVKIPSECIFSKVTQHTCYRKHKLQTDRDGSTPGAGGWLTSKMALYEKL